MRGVVQHRRSRRAFKSGRRTHKVLREGTHRSQNVEVTLRHVLRLAPIMGITRMANVTGLDSVGIPVVMVCRPNSRSVAVSQGKGIDLASARASGLMEAAELYHAETITLPLSLATYEQLRYQHNVVQVDELPRESGSRFQPNLRLLWCEGFDLLSGENVFVPYEMVHTNYTMPLPDGHGCFTASSNGLASGNQLVEAIGQAICEVIERDATTLWKLRGEEKLKDNRLDLESVDDRICREILGKFDRAGVCVAVWDITSDVGIAAFACFIVPRTDNTMWHCMVGTGYGCHPARQVALARALTEAAQARLTVISGGRDDFHRDAYDQWLDPDLVRAMRRRMTRSGPTRRFGDVPHRDGETLEDDVDWELKRLKKVGISRVVVVDLTKPELGLPVVRVIAPGLESILGRGYSPGRRGRLILAKQP
ncbi:MAG TPA: YcaO-like family protein [Chthoniobacterales bacterium]|jgi:YcaO-like protein with predicted kinase domain|nr:YcaO-like family protein [Chthoniobacterales bacterium]